MAGCNKYVQYMKDNGGRVSIGQFGIDWEPISGSLLNSMIDRNEVKVEGLHVVLIEENAERE